MATHKNVLPLDPANFAKKLYATGALDSKLKKFASSSSALQKNDRDVLYARLLELMPGAQPKSPEPARRGVPPPAEEEEEVSVEEEEVPPAAAPRDPNRLETAAQTFVARHPNTSPNIQGGSFAFMLYNDTVDYLDSKGNVFSKQNSEAQKGDRQTVFNRVKDILRSKAPAAAPPEEEEVPAPDAAPAPRRSTRVHGN
jgi:hypothetical protein